MKPILFLGFWSQQARASLQLTDGVPDDLLPYFPEQIESEYQDYAACELPRGSGLYSGVCAQPTVTDLPFCGDVVSYSACIQPTNPLWPSWTSTAKDAMVERLYNSAVSARISAEQASLSNGGANGTYMSLLFTGNDQCVEKYKRILCLYNFPECGEARSRNSEFGFEASPILGMCSQACVDFFTVCKFDAAVASEICQSSWPLIASIASKSVTNTSQIVDQSLGDCTGKNSDRSDALMAVVVAILALT